MEALSSRRAVERRLPQLTLLRDFAQPLERYTDYEEDGVGELRAESTIAEKFGKSKLQELTIVACLIHLVVIRIALKNVA